MFYKPRYVSYVLTHIGNNSRRDLETEEQLEFGERKDGGKSSAF
jgi:hypothetical protein